MKKLFLYTTILMLGFVVSSCSRDEVTQEPLATRSYDTDALLLSKFVSINKSEGRYYVDESKKVTPLSYITNKDWLELQKVNPINRSMYENELNSLNFALALAADRGDVSQIVYTTVDETWIRNINTDLSVNIEIGYPLETRAFRSIAAFTFRGDGYLESASFNAGRRVRSNIQFTNTGYKYYFFEISCETATKQGPSEGGSNPNAVVLSGTSQYFTNSDFIWTTTKSGENVSWVFKGKMRSPTDNNGTYVDVNFDNA